MNYYVYALVDPRNHIPFYIGKGKGNRKEHHLLGYTKGENIIKDNKINSIRNDGKEPYSIILKYFENENDAFLHEEKLIIQRGRIGIDLNGSLTNQTLGKRPPSRKGKKLSDEQKERKKGQIPWNKGLTKNESDSLARVGKINSEKMKGIIPWNKGFTKDTDDRIKEQGIKAGPKRKGRIPWNKGTSGVMKSNKTTFTTGHIPWNKSKLTAEDKEFIKNSKDPQSKIAKLFNISQSFVSQIKRS